MLLDIIGFVSESCLNVRQHIDGIYLEDPCALICLYFWVEID